MSLRAASAAGLVTAFQKPPSPLPVDVQTTAASGIRTMKLRYADHEAASEGGSPGPRLGDAG